METAILSKDMHPRNAPQHCKYAIDMIDGIACEHINNKEAFNHVMDALDMLEKSIGTAIEKSGRSDTNGKE